MPEAAKTEIEKDLRVEIEGPVDAAVNGIRRALSADLATDMQPWAGEFLAERYRRCTGEGIKIGSEGRKDAILTAIVVIGD